MKDVGIKVWVLTGDKVETAINIGISAGLLDLVMKKHIIDVKVSENELDQLEKLIENKMDDIASPVDDIFKQNLYITTRV